MKKRVFIIGLLLAVCLTLLVPTAAFAGTGDNRSNHSFNNARPVSFSGGGAIVVSGYESADVQGNSVRFTGEIVESFYQAIASDWEELDGTVFWSDHDSIVWLLPNGTVRGMMWGTFTMTDPGDGSALAGNFSGYINGTYAFYGDMLYFPTIEDQGWWYSTGGTGDFDGVRASGSWGAALAFNWDYQTLVGALDWSGSYQQMPAFSGRRR